jgi:putative transcriptional regulator
MFLPDTGAWEAGGTVAVAPSVSYSITARLEVPSRRPAGRPGPSAPSPRPIGENECVAEILAGRLLVATPLLGDPNFRRSVVLVVEDEPGEGTLGVVLNRPTETPVEQVLESWTDLVTQPSVVFRGGPVSPNSALALAIVPGEDEPVGWRALDGMTLRSRIGLVDLDAPPQLLEGGIASLRVFAGYAGWGPGQVQAEIEEGAWYVLPAEPADAFAAEPERLWQTVLRRAGGTLALVATYPDDPALN